MSVDAIPKPHKSLVDLIQLSAFYFHKLAADLVLGGVHRGIHDVAAVLGKRLQETHVSVESFAERLSSQQEYVPQFR
jgi:hypothetical protein